MFYGVFELTVRLKRSIVAYADSENSDQHQQLLS